jgi:amino acid permease
MIGAGVLSLPSAMSWLGWVGGLVSLLLFYSISLWCSLMLSGVDKANGKRHPTYSDAVLGILGRRSSRVLVVVQRVMLCLAAIGYAIAAADSMTYIANRSCSTGQSCVVKHWQMALVFGGEPEPDGALFPVPGPLFPQASWHSALKDSAIPAAM